MGWGKGMHKMTSTQQYSGLRHRAAACLWALATLAFNAPFHAAEAPSAETFALPMVWGPEQGNPCPVGGQPRWRLDQILPANPEDGAAYVPMAWHEGRKAWHNEQGSQGGQPDAKVTDGNLQLGVRARGGGNVDYVKGAALVFIAPQDGQYRFSSTVDVWRWEGGATTRLRGLKRFRKGDGWSVVPLSAEALKPEKGNTPTPIEATLKAGEELAIVAWHDGHWSGATVTLIKPTVTLVAKGTTSDAATVSAAVSFEPVAGAGEAGRPLPANSGFANVKDYGALGDGKADDTAAIQKAITENRNHGGRVVYLPAGVYRVTDTLTYGDNLEQAKFLTIQGQGRDQTVIKLQDNSPAFAQRKAVLSMFEGKTTGMAFNNSVYDLTIDVGEGNPGAVALEWMNNNTGSGERLRLRAGKDSGLVGFDLTKHEPGPGLIRDLIVEGFDDGVLSVQTCFSMTFENVTLKGQRNAGIRNNTQSLFLRKVHSENAVPAIVFADKTPWGGLWVYDSEFVGVGSEAAAGAAIVAGQPFVSVRNLRQRGYAKLIDLSKAKLPDLVGTPAKDGGTEQLGDWWPKVASKVSAFDGVDGKMLNLPIEETPDTAWAAPAQWAVVNPKRLQADYDDSPAIQEALDWAVKNGRTSVLVPGGQHVLFGSTITVPAGIVRIFGMDAMSGLTPDMARSTAPVWRVDAGDTPVVIERFFCEDFGGANRNETCVWIEQASQRTLVMAHGASPCDPYRGLPASKGARVFVNDWVGQFHFTGQQVWMRQFNPESNGEMLVNDGGTVWVFGTKTESETGTWFVTRKGGQTEVLGGYSYPSWRNAKSPAPKPLFVVEDGASFSASFREQVFQGYMCYPVILRQTRGGETKDLGRDCFTGAWAGVVTALPQTLAKVPTIP